MRCTKLRMKHLSEVTCRAHYDITIVQGPCIVIWLSSHHSERLILNIFLHQRVRIPVNIPERWSMTCYPHSHSSQLLNVLIILMICSVILCQSKRSSSRYMCWIYVTYSSSTLSKLNVSHFHQPLWYLIQASRKSHSSRSLVEISEAPWRDSHSYLLIIERLLISRNPHSIAVAKIFWTPKLSHVYEWLFIWNKVFTSIKILVT